ncbi:MAG: methylated-DNA--[protein]-cysteine S-methyltransferase [Pseudoflavonifractor sp.]|nr:methylated-DNA--[protein]-cysteine S-methyltransferase [Pseudoflavonifractor sp.]
MWYSMDWPSPLGELFALSDGRSLVGLWFEGQRKRLPHPNECVRRAALPIFREMERWLENYFMGKDPGPIPAAAPSGTAFQEAVWAQLRDIPYGKTVTYGALASRFTRPMSAQAVGGAVGRNPISILIPCHRVVGADGTLTGYAGGLWRKEALLKLEGSLI